MKKIIYTRLDGGLSVVIPAISMEDFGMTEEQALTRAWKRLPQDAIKPRIIDVADLPIDRSKRDAWEDKDGKIEVNLARVTLAVKE